MCVCFHFFCVNHFISIFSKMVFFSGLGLILCRGWISGRRWSISRGDRRGRVWLRGCGILFSWTNSRHPPFRLIISGVAFRLLKPGGFLRELSQSCVKDVFVGLYPPPKSENPGMLSESSSCRRGISVRRCGWLRVKCGRHHGRYLLLYMYIYN
jgi:hypothetical protein